MGLYPALNQAHKVPHLVTLKVGAGLAPNSHPGGPSATRLLARVLTASPVLRPGPETPLDCEVSLWSSWGLCGGPCGKLGAKSRTRYVRVQPANHGTPCPELEEEAECVPDNCV